MQTENIAKSLLEILKDKRHITRKRKHIIYEIRLIQICKQNGIFQSNEFFIQPN